MENRALLAVVVSLLILLVYQALLLPYFYPSLTDGRPSAEGTIETEQAPPLLPPEGKAEEPEVDATAPRQPMAPEQLVTVETDRFIAVVTSAGGRIKSFQLKQYRTTIDPNSSYQELVLPNLDQQLPFGVEFRGRSRSVDAAGRENQAQLLTVSDAAATYSIRGPATLQLRGQETGKVDLDWQGPHGTVRKTFGFSGERYDVTATLGITAVSPTYSEVAVTWEVPGEGKIHGTPEVLFDHTVFMADGKFVTDAFGSSELADGRFIPEPGEEHVDLAWAGLAGRHFLVAIIPTDGGDPRLWLKQRDDSVQTKLLFPLQEGILERNLSLYIGAKNVAALEQVGHHLERTVDLGYFSFIGFPLLWALRLSHTFTGNYGLDIILLTVVIKILFLPLTQKSFETMRAMQKLQPQMAKLREQYKEDQEALNKEMMELYRRPKVNPFGGCVPMLLQFPVFIGLYQALMNAVELRHSPFFMWIDDLSAPDRLGSIQLPFVDQPGIPVLTVFMGASMLAQQWMTPPAGDPAQQRVMMLMPLLFTFVFVNFPSGLVLYWLVNNVLTIAQQYYISRSPAA
jgi:YidC/Oxa1 family membrane protein insertase